jgi:hypothetical protein
MASVTEYLSLVGNKILVLRRNIELLKEQDYPSPGPAILAEVLVRILSRVFEELRLMSLEVDRTDEKVIVTKAVTIHHTVMHFLPPLIKAIISADVSSHFGGIIEGYGRICNLAQFGTELILYPSWEYNASYREIMGILRDLTEHLSIGGNKGIFDGTHPYVVSISFPALEEDVALRQALIAHEVGHFIDETRELSDKLIEQPILPKDTYGILASTLVENNSVLGEVRDFIGEALVNWIRELVADCLALRMLGPAYLFAFEEFTFTIPQNYAAIDLSRTHPPPLTRLRYLAILCNKLYMGEIQNSSQDSADVQLLAALKIRTDELASQSLPTVSRIRGISAISSSLAQTILEKLAQTLDTAMTYLDDTLGLMSSEPWSCSPTDIIHAVEMRRLLRDHLPPEELASQNVLPSFSAVINAAWLYYLEDHAQFDLFGRSENNRGVDSDLVFEQYLTAQRLTARAVESINFQNEYLRRGGRLQGR